MYAQNTGVSSERSRQEIERTLVRYGASSFAYGWEAGKAIIMFTMINRQIRFILPFPDKTDRSFARNGRGSLRTKEDIEKVWEQACRQKWRALSLAVKAKLECVESGITSFEEEFLAHIVLPSGITVGAALKPRLEDAYQTGKMPSLLLSGTSQ